MNTNLTQVIIETIEQSKTVLGEGFDFAKEQTPMVINEFLLWKFWEQAVWALLLAGSSICTIKLLIKVWRWAIAHDSNDKYPVVPACFLPAALSIVSVIILLIGLHCGLQAAKIKIAPRVYLIEYISEAVRK